MGVKCVSILMPVRNEERMLPHALSDLILGAFPGDEVLVIDDGSEDRTPQILAQWAARDSRINVVTTRGIGLVRALNLGFREATHGWVARADADDRYPKGRLASQRRALNRDVALVTGDYRLSPINGRSTYLPCAIGHPFVALSLIHPQRVPHPGLVLNRDAVVEAGGYLTEEFPAEDLGLWLRLSRQGRFVGVPILVVDWTMRLGSVSHSRQDQQRSMTEKLLASWRPTLLNEVNDAEVSHELGRYASSTYARERALLLLRDLRAWRERGEYLPGERQIIGSSVRHPLSNLRAGWRLAREARQRRRARSGLAFSTEQG